MSELEQPASAPPIPWYASKVIWTGVAQVAVGIGAATGMIDATTANNALGAAPEVVSGVLGAAVGIGTIIVRATAKAEPLTLRRRP